MAITRARSSRSFANTGQTIGGSYTSAGTAASQGPLEAVSTQPRTNRPAQTHRLFTQQDIQLAFVRPGSLLLTGVDDPVERSFRKMEAVKVAATSPNRTARRHSRFSNERSGTACIASMEPTPSVERVCARRGVHDACAELATTASCPSMETITVTNSLAIDSCGYLKQAAVTDDGLYVGSVTNYGIPVNGDLHVDGNVRACPEAACPAGPTTISPSCSQSATDTHHLQAFKTSALVRTCVTRDLRVTATVARQENLHACTASDGDHDRPRSQRRRRRDSAGPARSDTIPAERRSGRRHGANHVVGAGVADQARRRGSCQGAVSVRGTAEDALVESAFPHVRATGPAHGRSDDRAACRGHGAARRRPQSRRIPQGHRDHAGRRSAAEAIVARSARWRRGPECGSCGRGCPRRRPWRTRVRRGPVLPRIPRDAVDDHTVDAAVWRSSPGDQSHARGKSGDA